MMEELTAARRRELRKYFARLDAGAAACRVQQRHWDPDIGAYGQNKNVEIEYDRKQGAWQIVTYCERCGRELLYSVDKSSGAVVYRGRPKYDDNYLFRDGSGQPMNKQDRDYLRSLQLGSAARLSQQGGLRVVSGGNAS
jgi:hypothetical protein